MCGCDCATCLQNVIIQKWFVMFIIYTVSGKKPKHYRLSLEEDISNFNNFQYRYFWHNWPSNDHSIFHVTQCLFLHYLGKTQTTKYELKWMKIRQKAPPTLSIVTWRRTDKFLIIFGANIFDTACHQMTILVPTSLNVCFCTKWKNQNR